MPRRTTVEDLAEEYCLRRLSPDDETAFEEHYLSCPACAEQVERTQNFIRGLITAIGDRDLTATAD